MSERQYRDRREAAEFMTSLGLRVAPTTLAKYATLGGGPVMRHWGRRVIYDTSSLVEWANTIAKLTAPCRSTSDAEGMS